MTIKFDITIFVWPNGPDYFKATGEFDSNSITTDLLRVANISEPLECEKWEIWGVSLNRMLDTFYFYAAAPAEFKRNPADFKHFVSWFFGQMERIPQNVRFFKVHPASGEKKTEHTEI